MCGIFAYIGNKKAGQIMLEGITILQNRGYDSVGMTTLNHENNFIVSKFVSVETTSNAIVKLSEDLEKHENNTIGMVHSRWSTTGERSVKNCHPHFDGTGRFSVVHNGVIENYREIKEFLSQNGIECVSETDTEVIVQLVSYYSRDYDFKTSVSKAVSKLEGTWGLVFMDRENPKTLIVTRRGSPILIGIGNNEYYISSEISAFQRYTTHYICVNDDEIIVIEDNQMYIDNYNVNDRVQVSQNNETILLNPDPYPHWTIREIKEQEYTILKALNNGGRILDDSKVILGGLNNNKSSLLSIKNLIIIACGTSLYAGKYVGSIFRKISGFDTVQVINASQLDQSYLDTPNVGILCISQSGETRDVINCLEMIDDNIPTFSVINKVNSEIPRKTKCGVYLNAGREVGVASTKSFTSSAVVLILISIWFAQNRDKCFNYRSTLINSLNKMSICFKNVLNDNKLEEKCKDVSKYLKEYNTCFILGSGISNSIAAEASLKLKEIGYLHAEGYLGKELKHGPFALIDDGTPIIVILLDDKYRKQMESTVSEIVVRGAHPIIITDFDYRDENSKIIRIPNNGELTSLISIIPLQLIAYHLSLEKEINCDKPKHLAKVCTTI